MKSKEMEIWMSALDLTYSIYQATKVEDFSGNHLLKNQIREVSFSLANNIAGCNPKHSHQDILKSLIMAKYSCRDLRRRLTAAFDEKYVERHGLRHIVNRCGDLSTMIDCHIEDIHLDNNKRGEKCLQNQVDYREIMALRRQVLHKTEVGRDTCSQQCGNRN